MTVSQLGLINGYPDGTFRPNEPLTRAEFKRLADEVRKAAGIAVE